MGIDHVGSGESYINVGSGESHVDHVGSGEPHVSSMPRAHVCTASRRPVHTAQHSSTTNTILQQLICAWTNRRVSFGKPLLSLTSKRLQLQKQQSRRRPRSRQRRAGRQRRDQKGGTAGQRALQPRKTSDAVARQAVHKLGGIISKDTMLLIA